jgi:DNA-binding transcriptional MerR regulator
MLRATDMPIRDMLQFVKLTRAGDRTIPQRLELLGLHREKLAQRITDLSAHLESLDKKIDFYSKELNRSKRGRSSPTRCRK